MAEALEQCLRLSQSESERVTSVNHNTGINWVKQAHQALPEEDDEIPETAQVDELQTFVGSKKSKCGFGSQ
ncbi:IS1 transposase (plasmid) [Leptolyngbya boryana NIES-2135]|uniref:IS1 transposase n=1 Tax=Leptolyngbya boryana NIES-2135 TaxID=1973484 RepID=A0A1Z4JQX0_LEPBY|nr:IS1 transposase [Leptolyngbya boryana NIES-2135]